MLLSRRRESDERLLETFFKHFNDFFKIKIKNHQKKSVKNHQKVYFGVTGEKTTAVREASR